MNVSISSGNTLKKFLPLDSQRIIIMNYYFFIAGVLSILFAIIHTMLGEKFVFYEFKKNPISKNIYNKLFINWLQVTASFLVIGMALIYISFLPHLNRRDFAPALILIFLVVDFLIFISVLFSRHLGNAAHLVYLSSLIRS